MSIIRTFANLAQRLKVAATAPEDGQVLAFNSTSGEYEPATPSGGGSGGSAITVKDEGTDLTTALASINFTGDGVTATHTGDAVTVDIPASGGGGGLTSEQVMDTIAAMLVAGTNITLTYNDAGDELTIDAAGGGGGSSPISARYWRLRRVQEVNAHSSDGFGVSELKWLDGSNANMVGSGTPIYSVADTGGGWSGAEAYDGSTASGDGWYSGTNTYGGWIGYDFGSAVSPVSISFAPLNGFAWSIGAQVAVDYSYDGVAWRPHSIFTCAAGANGTYQTFALAALP